MDYLGPVAVELATDDVSSVREYASAAVCLFVLIIFASRRRLLARSAFSLDRFAPLVSGLSYLINIIC